MKQSWFIPFSPLLVKGEAKLFDLSAGYVKERHLLSPLKEAHLISPPNKGIPNTTY